MNFTSTMNPDEILIASHSFTAIPSIWILFTFMSLIFLIIGLLLINKNRSGYKKFFIIWIVATSLNALFAIFLTLSPNTIQFVINNLNKLMI